MPSCRRVHSFRRSRWNKRKLSNGLARTNKLFRTQYNRNHWDISDVCNTIFFLFFFLLLLLLVDRHARVRVLVIKYAYYNYLQTFARTYIFVRSYVFTCIYVMIYVRRLINAITLFVLSWPLSFKVSPIVSSSSASSSSFSLPQPRLPTPIYTL